MSGTCFNILLNRPNVCWMNLNYGDLFIRGLPWISLQQHVVHGLSGLVNGSFVIKDIQFGNFFHLPVFRGKLKDDSAESGKNLVKAGHFLKFLWDWLITFLSWCRFFRSKASAMLHHQGLNDSLYLHTSSTFTCYPLCIGKRVLEICVSCEVVWGVLCPFSAFPVQ